MLVNSLHSLHLASRQLIHPAWLPAVRGGDSPIGCVTIDNPSSTATISWRRTCSFPEMRKQTQNFDKVRRYSKSLFLLTDFCKATHPTATKRVDREQMVAIANQLLSLTYTYARGEFEDAIDEYLSQLPVQQKIGGSF